MRIRKVLQEYEVKLASSSAGVDSPYLMASGKGEWKLYEDGTRRCKVSIRGLNLPEGTMLQLAVNGRPIGEVYVQPGPTRYRRETERGEVVPEVAAGQVLQVTHLGQVILEGRFYEE